ncbi:hypothetical protein N499_1169 [Wolbachia pipientis wVitA]|nr:hypothetical protein N499_1169 [Wolbachia pipientis wVitA]
MQQSHSSVTCWNDNCVFCFFVIKYSYSLCHPSVLTTWIQEI